MRILKFIFRSVLTLIILGAVSFLLGREILLMLGYSRLKSDLSTLGNYATQKQYLTACKQKGSTYVAGDDPAVLQLRFFSPNQYVLEVLCSQFSIDPIVIKDNQLPWLVTAGEGHSGVIYGKDRSGLVIELWDRQRAIGVESRQVQKFNPQDDLGSGPKTICAGYGFTCCNIESQQGLGEQLTEVMDCPRSCFTACEQRPVVLSLNTEPALDLKTRSLTVTSGDKVEFSYVIDAGLEPMVSATLDFGDGQTEVTKQDRQITSHVYRCAEQECQYQVKLSVADEQGVTAVELPITSLTVVVKGSP